MPLELLACVKQRPVNGRPIFSSPSSNGFSVSLFDDSEFRYHETYFLHFQKENRPAASDVVRSLRQLGPGFEQVDVCEPENRDSDNSFGDVTLRIPHDNAAISIAYNDGDEVVEQGSEMLKELQTATIRPTDFEKITRLQSSDARFEIFLFESSETTSADNEHVDPGGFLLAINSIAELCQGVCIDPASNTLL